MSRAKARRLSRIAHEPLATHIHATTETSKNDHNLGNVGTGEVGGKIGTIVGAPEPSTWAMMLLGFAGLGFAGYRKARGARAALLAA
jgi:PEP-CTERM motif